VTHLDDYEAAAQRRREKFERARAERADRNSPRRKRVRRVLWAGGGILSVMLATFALTSPRFDVVQVEVEGAHLTSPNALERAQGALEGKNYFRAPTRKIAAYLRTFPPVRDVHVARLATWPPRLVIRIEERQAFARVASGADWWVADEQGVPFRRATNKDEALEAIYNAGWNPQLGRSLTPATWNRARTFTQLLQKERAAGNNWKLHRIYFDKHGFASLRLAGGWNDETLVQLGGDKWLPKLQRARASLKYLQETERRASVLNLITYSMPVWTPRQPDSLPRQAASDDERNTG
jgi:hypothetical protein